MSWRCYCVLHLDYRTKHSSKARKIISIFFISSVILKRGNRLDVIFTYFAFPFLPQQLGGDISNGCSKDYSTLIMEERFKAEERKEIIGEEWRKISKIFDRQIIF